MDIELIDIINKENNVIGTTDVDTAHEKKTMHRVVGVFLFDINGNLYLQKNIQNGKFDLSVGGHVKKGESYEDAVQREMAEELNLKVSLSHVSTFLPKNARLNHFWSIYTAIAPPEWHFEETEEVKLLEKMSMKKIIALLKSNSDSFTYGFINTMEELIKLKKIC